MIIKDPLQFFSLQSCTCDKDKLLNNCAYCLGFANGYLIGLITVRLPSINKEIINNAITSFGFLDNKVYQTGFAKGEELGKQLELKEADKIDYYFPLGSLEFGETYHGCIGIMMMANYGIDISCANFVQIGFVSSLFKTKRIKFDEYRYNAYKHSEEKEEFKINSCVGLGTATQFISEKFRNSQSKCKELHEAIFKAMTTTFIQAFPHSIEAKFINFVKLHFKIDESDTKNCVILVVRNKTGPEAWRNLHPEIFKQLLFKLKEIGVTKVILLGDKNTSLGYQTFLTHNFHISDQTDLHNIEHFKKLVGFHSIAGQIYLHKILCNKFGVGCVLGMKSGALDGPAFAGVPTIFLTNDNNQNARMNKAAADIPTLKPVKYDEERIKASYYSKNSAELNSNELQSLQDTIDIIFHPKNSHRIDSNGSNSAEETQFQVSNM